MTFGYLECFVANAAQSKLSSHRNLLCLTNYIPSVYHTGDPAQDAKCDVDEEVGGATALHGDGEEGDPYCEEVEEDCTLSQCEYGNWRVWGGLTDCG